MAMRSLLLAGCLASARAVQLCAVPVTQKTTLDDTCASSAGNSSVAAVDAARGEIEGVQLLLDNAGGGAAPSAVGVSITWAAGAAPAGVSVAGIFLVTYVHTEASPRYAGSRAGWFADALLPWPAGGLPLPANGQLTAWVSFNVSAAAAPGVFEGALVAAGASLPLRLTVWRALVPALADSPFKTIYAFDQGPAMKVYGSAVDANATLLAYMDALAALRFPATNIYADAPLPIWQYEKLAQEGAPVLILADISNLPFSTEDGRPLPPPEAAARRRGRRALAGERAPAAACPTFSPSYISSMVALLQPAWDALGAMGKRGGRHGLRL